MCAYAFKSMVHCGSDFKPGASGLPYYCTSTCVRSCCTWRATCVATKQNQKYSVQGIIREQSCGTTLEKMVSRLSELDHTYE